MAPSEEVLSKCPICSSSKITDFISDVQVDRPTTAWNLCENCGHLFVSPRPTKAILDAFYKNGYREQIFGVEEDPEKIPTRSVQEETQRAIRLTNLIMRYKLKVKRHLDLGSSTGVMLAGIVDRCECTEAVGIEPGDAWRQFAENAFTSEVPGKTKNPRIAAVRPTWYTDLKEVPKAKKFDLITIMHTLEHMLDPMAVLVEMKGRLLKDGLLVMEVPNMFGGAPVPLMWPHMHCFTTQTMHSVLERAGYDILTIETFGTQPPFFVSPQHIAVVASPKPDSYDLRTVLSRYNLFRQHIGFVQGAMANAQQTYEMG